MTGTPCPLPRTLQPRTELLLPQTFFPYTPDILVTSLFLYCWVFWLLHLVTSLPSPPTQGPVQSGRVHFGASPGSLPLPMISLIPTITFLGAAFPPPPLSFSIQYVCLLPTKFLKVAVPTDSCGCCGYDYLSRSLETHTSSSCFLPMNIPSHLSC